MLEALALSRKWGGQGWHDAFCLCLPPQEEQHLLLPDGFHPSPVGMTGVLQVSVSIRQLQKCGFPMSACTVVCTVAVAQISPL